MSGVTLDAGGLIALDRNDRRVIALLARASEILSRRRALTVDMIHKISDAWKIPADLLVRPYRVDRVASREQV